jgi:DNA-directed RNA polymerase specialized sigma24 family protein
MMSLAELGAGPRTSLLLRERDAMSVAEIAATLNATPQQVREWLFEARERLCAAGHGVSRRLD